MLRGTALAGDASDCTSATCTFFPLVRDGVFCCTLTLLAFLVGCFFTGELPAVSEVSARLGAGVVAVELVDDPISECQPV